MKLENYLEENKTTILEELKEFLRIPSISALPQHQKDVQRAADWLAEKLKAIGLENVKIYPTGGHPVVYGDWLHAQGKPTVLIYGHYDVQPVDPLTEWTTSPFEPEIEDNEIRGRGTSDDKGQLMIHLAALEYLFKKDGKLPINVKVFVEGEEEIGGPHLDDFIEKQADLLEANGCLISDTSWPAIDRPAIVTGVRGLVYMQIDLKMAETDLHSGTYGGNVDNPNNILSHIISQLKDQAGNVLVPGFYDDVRSWSATDRQKINQSPFKEEEIRETTGVLKTHGVGGFTPRERAGIRPTLDVNGLWGGFAGEGPKTVIPKEAGAKISMRLVADQNPEDITQKFVSYVESLVPETATIKIECLSADRATVVNLDSPYLKTASQVIKTICQTEPELMMGGGSIPVAGHIKEYLGIDTIFLGFGLADDRIHAPNEKFSLEQFWTGIKVVTTFYDRLTST